MRACVCARACTLCLQDEVVCRGLVTLRQPKLGASLALKAPPHHRRRTEDGPIRLATVRRPAKATPSQTAPSGAARASSRVKFRGCALPLIRDGPRLCRVKRGSAKKCDAPCQTSAERRERAQHAIRPTGRAAACYALPAVYKRRRGVHPQAYPVVGGPTDYAKSAEVLQGRLQCANARASQNTKRVA